MKILVTRTDLRVAPDSVGFEVDVTGAGFETPAPASREDYDRQFHELHYVWSFDDPGEYTAPVNILAEWRDSNVAYGPFVRHMFEKPGLYTVRVRVTEMKTDKVAEATINVLVGDPDEMFFGTRTLVVSDDPNEKDWAGAPARSLKFTSLGKALEVYREMKAPGRLLFKRDGQFSSVSIVTSTRFTQPLYFGTWGIGERPILRQTRNDQPYDNIFGVINLTHDRRVDIRIMNMDMRGRFDSTRSRGKPIYAIRTLIPCNLMISGCRAEGFGGLVNVQASDVKKINELARMKHIHNSSIGDFMSYPVYSSPVEGSEIAYTGLRIDAHPGAVSATIGNQGGSPIRIGSADRTYIDGCDIFSRQAHDATINGPSQPCIKFNNGGRQDGLKINMARTSCEGGLYVIFIGGKSLEDQIPNLNMIIDKCVLVGDQGSINFIYSTVGGLTFRNSLCIFPPGPWFLNPQVEFLNFASWFTRSTPVNPFRDYNNTYVTRRTQKENKNVAVSLVTDKIRAKGSVSANNVVYMPEQVPPRIADLPLDLNTLLWRPRNLGVKPNTTMIMDTTYATHPDTVASYAPLEGSDALGDAEGDWIAVDDITGRIRPTYPSRGAWEMPE